MARTLGLEGSVLGMAALTLPDTVGGVVFAYTVAPRIVRDDALLPCASRGNVVAHTLAGVVFGFVS